MFIFNLREMSKYRIIFLGFLWVCWTIQLSAQSELWKSEYGSAHIESDAPLEMINAESKALRGIINPANKSFAIVLSIKTFEGFNSEIQKTHFQENYLEQKKFPQATFTGKLIEDIPFDLPGIYSVRAKGNLEIHGIVKERIIRGTLTIRKGSAHLQSTFLVPVSDHGITIPKIVQQKIAEVITVDIEMEFALDIKS